MQLRRQDHRRPTTSWRASSATCWSPRARARRDAASGRRRPGLGQSARRRRPRRVAAAALSETDRARRDRHEGAAAARRRIAARPSCSMAATASARSRSCRRSALAVERAKQRRHLLRAHPRDDAYRRHRALRAMDRGARLRRPHHGRRAGLVAYHGARVASMGTSPIAIAVPSGSGPIVLDMATSTISNGKIIQARATGKPLPPDTALTAAGEPTTDPRQAEILLPLGGPKGSGPRLDVRNAGERARAPRRSRPPRSAPRSATRRIRNSAILAIDIATFRPLADFTHDADALAAILKALPRQAGFDEITAARRALRPHRSAAPQIRHPDSGKAVGGARGHRQGGAGEIAGTIIGCREMRRGGAGKPLGLLAGITEWSSVDREVRPH